MKKLLFLLAALLLLTACGQTGEKSSEAVSGDTTTAEPTQVSETVSTEETPLPEQPITLRMAVSSLNYEVSYYDSLIEEFNGQGNITVVKEDYGSDGERLLLELAAGDGPDLLISFSNDGVLTEKGCLLDLYSLLDSDPELSREDFTNLDLLAYGDVLTRVSPGYVLNCPFGLTASYPETTRESWTLEAFLSALTDSQDPGQVGGSQSGSTFLLEYTLGYAQEYVDYQAGTCDYETDAFYGLLEAAKAVDEVYVADSIHSAGDTYTSLFSDYPQLICTGYIAGMAGYTTLMQELNRCDVTFLGFPTEQGGKTTAQFVDTVSGCSMTAYPEEVWAFLRYVLTAPSVQEDTSLFPVYTAALEQQMETAQNTEPSQAEMTFQEAMVAQIRGDTKIACSQEAAQQLRELIYGDCMFGGYDEALTPIIQEETAAFFAGDKTAEETAGLVQNRASIYLAEQK